MAEGHGPPVEGKILEAKHTTDVWRTVAFGMFIVFIIACSYMIVTLGDIKERVQDIDNQVGIIEHTQDFYTGIITDNQREIIDLLKNHKLTPDDLEKLREEILKK